MCQGKTGNGSTRSAQGFLLENRQIMRSLADTTMLLPSMGVVSNPRHFTDCSLWRSAQIPFWLILWRDPCGSIRGLDSLWVVVSLPLQWVGVDPTLFLRGIWNVADAGNLTCSFLGSWAPLTVVLLRMLLPWLAQPLGWPGNARIQNPNDEYNISSK